MGLALALSGCDGLPKLDMGDLPDGKPDGAADTTPDASATGSQLGSITGQVFQADTLAPLAGATITGPGGISVKTDKHGQFKLSMLATERTALLANLEGYAQAVEPVVVRANQDAKLEFRLLAVTARAEFAAEQGGKVRAKSGAEVSFESASFVDGEGKAVTGQVKVEVTVVDPSTPEGLQAFPGDFAASNKSGADGQLESFVPMEITVKQGDKTLDFAPNKGADVSFPVPSRLENKAPPTVAVWSLSEATGAWVEEGIATLITDGTGKVVYRTHIQHMSWWNCDRFLDKISCIRGCVTLDGKPAPGVRTQAEGIDYASLGEDITDAEGCFSEDVKSGAQLRVRALADDAATEWKVITASETRMSVKDDPKACADVGTLELVTQKPADAGCPVGTSKCGDVCVDLASDYDNCGSCDNSCFGQLQGSQCIAEKCTCAGSETMCEGRGGMACTDLTVDESNCGGCGKLCAVGQTCEEGACKQRECGKGLTLCGSACVDAENNSQHCGGCDMACAMGETCNAGACEKLACRDGSVACGTECVAQGQCGNVLDCSQNEFCPSTKEPVSVCNVCNGKPDCTNGEDEAPRGGDGPCVLCRDGTLAWGCNGFKDCADGEDELNCGSGGGTMTMNCGANMFACTNSNVCWPSTNWCNGTRDCADGSDEAKCDATGGPTCGANMFGCPNSKECFPASSWCNGNRDCTDGSDEAMCTPIDACPMDMIICPNDSCAPTEKECGSGTACPPNYVSCPNGDCALTAADCASVISCNPGQMGCNDAAGAPLCTTQCDGKAECADGRDEDPRICCEMTKGLYCEDPKSAIAGGKCVPDANLCDKVQDCPSGEDEDPAYCCQRTGDFYCYGDQKCLAQGLRCDGMPDCVDGSDETINTCGCPKAGEMPCRDGLSCMPEGGMCDTVLDCKDGSDEGPASCGCATGQDLCDSGTEVTCVPTGTCQGVDCTSCMDPSCCALRDCSLSALCGGGPVQCPEGSGPCPDGKTCATDPAMCPPTGGGTTCPAGAFLCSDGRTCVDDPTMCPPTATCPAGATLCPDGKTCADDPAKCPPPPADAGVPQPCPAGAILCPDGRTCADGLAMCPPTATCPAGATLCPDGKTCADDPAKCPPPPGDAGVPPQCPAGMGMCPDGKTCASTPAQCPGAGGGGPVQCPPDMKLCPDAKTCVIDLAMCP